MELRHDEVFRKPPKDPTRRTRNFTNRKNTVRRKKKIIVAIEDIRKQHHHKERIRSQGGRSTDMAGEDRRP